MDQIVKTDVNDEEIDPFMKDIKRYFEFIDKEDIIKKIVSMEFGKFLAYYADAPEIEKPSTKATREDRRGGNSERKGQRGDRSGARRGQRKAESGYRRLFINLGKSDGFYPGEVMQYINKHVEGRQDVGHIDLMSKFSYIEVPEKDADKVIRALDGTVYKGREVRCNDADSKGHGRGNADENGRNNGKADTDGYGRVKSDKSRGGKAAEKPKKRQGKSKQTPFEGDTGDWRQFFKGNDVKFKGDEPDFSEEGWAIRKPRKKK